MLAIPGWLIIRWYIKPANAEERKDAITLLFQTLGGVAFLLGVLFTWQQLTNSREELKTSREGQITERYTRAIDQLGKTEDETKNLNMGRPHLATFRKHDVQHLNAWETCNSERRKESQPAKTEST